jgi:hypothetical protein
LFLRCESQELCRRIAVESFSFLSVSCDQVFVIGNARLAFIAGPIAVGTEATGGTQRAIVLADRLALIVCAIFAHLRPVFHAALPKCGLSRKISDALAKHVWRALAAFFFGRSMVDAAIFALGSPLFTKMTKARFNSSD